MNEEPNERPKTGLIGSLLKDPRFRSATFRLGPVTRPTTDTISVQPETEPTQEEKYGCLVRALESVTGQQANQDEWLERLQQVWTSLDELTRIKSLPVQERQTALKQLFEQGKRDTLAYIEWLSGQETDLGTALSAYEVSSTEMTGEQLRQAVTSENQEVLVSGWIEDEHEIYYHVTHVKTSNGSLVSQSDGQLPINFEDNRVYDILLLRRK